MTETRVASRRGLRRSIARIVVPYALFAALWILLSDRALDRLFADQAAYAAYSTRKGLLFVGVTALLLWLLLRIELARRATAEAALQRTTRQLERAQQVANVGQWTWEIQSDRLEWSAQMFRIFGIDRDTFSGRVSDVVRSAIHPDDRAAVEAANRDVLEGRGPTALEYRVIRPDGVTRAVWAEGADLEVDADGVPVRLSGVVQDITDRKELEQRFLRAQRTEAVGVLASGIAHDLNNVLTPVMMIAPLLRGRVVSREDREMLDTLEQAAQRGSDIIRQLLTFARGEPGARMRLPLRHLLREMETIARDTFPSDIDIRTEAPRDLWHVEGDITQVHQLLMNLCLNARDAMPQGGCLTLGAANVRVGEHEVAPDAQPGPYVRLSVSDSGCGIEARHRERIFDPFFTTKDVGKGTGLGLSSVLGIVRGHGGFVRVESRPGHGSRFDVYVPATIPESIALGQPAEMPRARDSALVLVVDDEAAVRDTLTQTLAASGYRVVAAADGAEGLAAFEAHQDEVRVILTDLMMPVMSGAAMVGVLRARGVRVPFVAMSGAMDPQGAPLSLQPDTAPIQATAWLAKPFAPRDVLDTLDRVLRQETPPDHTLASGAGEARE